MNKSMSFAMFMVGAAIGSIVTWRYTVKKYTRIAQEEIDSVKEVFSKDFTTKEEPIEKKFTTREKPNIAEYAAKLKKYSYTNYTEVETEEKEEGDSSHMDNKEPYIISPDQFGELDDYETIGLTYYANDILTDDNDLPVEDINVVGEESLNHFGEYEEDSVFVRNDKLKCDYEILLDHREYSDFNEPIIRDKKPHEE